MKFLVKDCRKFSEFALRCLTSDVFSEHNFDEQEIENMRILFFWTPENREVRKSQMKVIKRSMIDRDVINEISKTDDFIYLGRNPDHCIIYGLTYNGCALEFEIGVLDTEFSCHQYKDGKHTENDPEMVQLGKQLYEREKTYHV